MDYYDLSGDSLTEFPDLSRYVIRSLDLSYNRLLNPQALVNYTVANLTL